MESILIGALSNMNFSHIHLINLWSWEKCYSRNGVHQLQHCRVSFYSSGPQQDCLLGVEYPSPLKTWPKWPPQAVQVISILVIPKVRSSCLVTAPGNASKNAGHPHPELNLVVLLYSGVPQPAHSYTPSLLNLSYSPVPARSVPFSRRILN